MFKRQSVMWLFGVLVVGIIASLILAVSPAAEKILSRCSDPEPLGSASRPEVSTLRETLWVQHAGNQCGQNVTIGLLLYGGVPSIPGSFSNQEKLNLQITGSTIDDSSQIGELEQYVLTVNTDVINLIRFAAPDAKLRVYVLPNLTPEAFIAGANALISDQRSDIVLNGIAYADLSFAPGMSLERYIADHADVLWLHTSGLYGQSHIKAPFGDKREQTYTVQRSTLYGPAGTDYIPRFFVILHDEGSEASPDLKISFRLAADPDAILCQPSISEGVLYLYPVNSFDGCQVGEGKTFDTTFMSAADTFTITIRPLSGFDARDGFEIFGQNVVFEKNIADATGSMPSPNNMVALNSLSVGITSAYVSYTTSSKPSLMVDGTPRDEEQPNSLYGLAYAGGAAALMLGEMKPSYVLTRLPPQDIATLTQRLLIANESGTFRPPYPLSAKFEIVIGGLGCAFIWVIVGLLVLVPVLKQWRMVFAFFIAVLFVAFVYSRFSREDVALIQSLTISTLLVVSSMGIAILAGLPITQAEMVAFMKSIHPALGSFTDLTVRWGGQYMPSQPTTLVIDLKGDPLPFELDPSALESPSSIEEP